MFFDLLFYAASLSENSSLESLCSYLKRQYNISLRKQSLDERFKDKTIDFVKAVLRDLLEEQFSGLLYERDFLGRFSQVRIKDSTRFNVPFGVSLDYCIGRGGKSTSRGVSIQYEFEIKTGKILDLNLTESNRPDQRDAKETCENITKDDLIIRDLGYFSVSILQTFARKGVFFLSRLKSISEIFEENGIKIDFKKLYARVKNSDIKQREIKVLIGKERLPVRMVIYLLPEEVYAERIRNREETARRKKRSISDKTRFFYHFNVVITNAESDILPTEKIYPLYRIRWQVELMFKNWKSVFSLHKLQKMKSERYITMLYIRLILIVINLQIINSIQFGLTRRMQNTRSQSLLSYTKVLRTQKTMFDDLMKILNATSKTAFKQAKKIYGILSENHWREQRKNKQSFCEIIELFTCKYDK